MAQEAERGTRRTERGAQVELKGTREKDSEMIKRRLYLVVMHRSTADPTHDCTGADHMQYPFW
jgi:hypothetical protein